LPGICAMQLCRDKDIRLVDYDHKVDMYVDKQSL